MIVWEMFLIPVSLAVTAVLSNCTLQILDEPPDNITVPRGSPLTLYCSGTCQGGARRDQVEVTWHLSANGSKKDGSDRTFTSNNGSSQEKIWCNHTITNVQDKHHGLYYCNVTLKKPIFLRKSTNGTLIVVARSEMEVTANPGTKTPGFINLIQHKTFVIVSGVSAVLLILLVVMICVVKRRRQRHKEMICPVYGNTRPPLPTRRQKTSKPDTPVASKVPPQAQTPLNAKCQDVPEQDTSP